MSNYVDRLASVGPLNRRPLTAVVLAAGEGTRMHSQLPKPLHQLCGRPMILYVLDALAELPIDRVVVVVGHGAEQVTKIVHSLAPSHLIVEFVEQPTQRGTGDAVAVALTALPDPIENGPDGDVVVLPGDTPLLRPQTLASLVRLHRESDSAATLLTAQVYDPTGYGRIVRDKHGEISRIVEDADCDYEESAIDEICTSIYVFRHSVIGPALRRLLPTNAQGEYYLTDTVQVLAGAGYTVTSQIVDDAMEAAGVNDRSQLAIAEAELRDRTNARWMMKGVTMLDPERCYVDASVELEADVLLLPGTILQGFTRVAKGAEIGPDTRLVDCIVGERSVVADTVGFSAEIGSDAKVGPFALLNPGSRVADGEITGPFFQASEES
ncbi:MAG: bifunctional N-acetylglucosamine-1-phosphate uridyltransferase/glucosamine-1-phosphate acetyltransferase [Acidimicrobiales bacterium]|nr:bifunctional N-acetylglucosamine-1-phosphate uridyltransferase/glucosamine-1-phosphate acetyltransferase [Acidimicrobiales bacterium]